MIAWLAVASPIWSLEGAEQDCLYRNTMPWSWEEGIWTAEAGAHVILQTPYDFIGGAYTRVVINGEPTLVMMAPKPPLRSEHPLASHPKLFLRCVGPPATDDGPGPWRIVESILPRLAGLASPHAVLAAKLEPWARMRGYSGSPVAVVPHGAELPPPSGEVALPRRGAAFIGRIVPEKRVDVIAQAAILAGVPLTVAGFTSDPAMTEKVAALQAQRPDLITMAFLAQAAKSQLFKSVRAVVMATVEGGDTIWIPGLEARAYGAVALASETIRDFNGDGVLYHDNTVEGIAAVLRRLHEDDEFFHNEQGRQHDWFLWHGQTSADVGQAFRVWLQV